MRTPRIVKPSRRRSEAALVGLVLPPLACPIPEGAVAGLTILGRLPNRMGERTRQSQGMSEVQVSYDRSETGGWTAKISGDFAGRCEGSTPAEVRRRVSAELASQGATYPTFPDRGTDPDAPQTVVYA